MREQLTDFGASFLTYVVKDRANYGRFGIESVCTVRDAAGAERCFLLHPVFACDVFGTGGLFKDPPYRFQAAFSADRFRIFRTSPGSGERHDSSGAITSSFEGIELCDRRRDMRLLENGREIIRCARANGTIVAQASFEHGRVTVTVEFPVRHINADPERGAFQVETGTVALPAGPDRGRSALDQLEVHYVAFNTLTWMSVLPLPDGPARRLDCAIRLYGCGAS